ncbi:unnamed protein product, partial [Ectocarpus sp. 6 AP-2014]
HTRHIISCQSLSPLSYIYQSDVGSYNNNTNNSNLFLPLTCPTAVLFIPVFVSALLTIPIRPFVYYMVSSCFLHHLRSPPAVRSPPVRVFGACPIYLRTRAGRIPSH